MSGVRLFPVHPSPHFSLEITDLVTMAATTWTLHTNHGIIDILLCHVYKGIHHHTNQNEPPSGKYRNALQYISPNCHYILSHISQSHVSPKTILKVTKKFAKRKQAHVGMKSSKTNQTRRERHHNTFTPSLHLVPFCQNCVFVFVF